MKTIYKGKDDLYFNISIEDPEGNSLLPSDLDAFTIHFFTTGKQEITYTKQDVFNDTVIHLEQDDLATLDDGALKMFIEIGISDESWNDSAYNRTAERLTGYFLKTRKEVQQ